MLLKACFNKIYKADVFDFLNALPQGCIDLAIIDPSYNLKVADWDCFASEIEFLEFSKKWIKAMLPKLKENAGFYIFNTPYNAAIFINILREIAPNIAFQNLICWYKKDGMSANKKRFNSSQESIIFYTMNPKNYYFDSDSIRIPYESTERIAHAAKKGILKNAKRCLPNPLGKLGFIFRQRNN